MRERQIRTLRDRPEVDAGKRYIRKKQIRTQRDRAEVDGRDIRKIRTGLFLLWLLDGVHVASEKK